MSERTIFLDIETIPTQSQSVRERIAAGVKPPASMSKPETIAKWEAESKPQAVADAIAKTSFDPAYGHICTIAWAVDGEPARSWQIERVEHEADALELFFGEIDSHHHATFVGHYVTGFDLRFILCRAVVLGVKIPACIPRDLKPWGGRVFDTMTAWAGVKGTISMDNLCEALGIEGKGDFTGADVAGAFERGEFERIREYCESDVERTRQIWRRFKAAGY